MPTDRSRKVPLPDAQRNIRDGLRTSYGNDPLAEKPAGCGGQEPIGELRDERRIPVTWVPNAIVDEWIPRLGHAATIVYLTLARHAASDGKCFPSVPTIGRKAALSRPRVYAALAILREHGLIRRNQTRAGGPTVTTLASVEGSRQRDEGVSSARPGGSRQRDEGVSLTRRGGSRQRDPKDIHPRTSIQGRINKDFTSPLVAAVVAVFSKKSIFTSEAATRDRAELLVGNLDKFPEFAIAIAEDLSDQATKAKTPGGWLTTACRDRTWLEVMAAKRESSRAAEHAAAEKSKTSGASKIDAQKFVQEHARPLAAAAVRARDAATKTAARVSRPSSSTTGDELSFEEKRKKAREALDRLDVKEKAGR